MASESSEHKHKEGLIKPGNEEYLSYYKDQNEFKCTEPRRPVAAMSGSPGPGIVNLPPSLGVKDHDPRKTKAPAYTIGLKDDRVTFSCGEVGPAAYDIRKKTNKGLDVCHAPIMGKLLEGVPIETSPGPAAYHRGESDKYVYRKSPAYTMRKKTKTIKSSIQTDPSKYKLPDTLGPGRSPFQKSPCYSMGEKLTKTGVYQPRPGPTDYTLPPLNLTKPEAPAFTMKGREETKRVEKTGISSPGPASNYYHMVKFNKPSTPRFTFGVRHSPYKAFQKFAAET